jgi:[ribosomal protein S18]-alanine N-acetyltransferase
MRRFLIRSAAPADAESLLRLENLAFDADRISARSFRRLIRSRTAACRLVRAGLQVAGYTLLLFRKGTTVARLYSIAVAADWRHVGLAAALVEDAEGVARLRGMTRLRLEVREDNLPAIRLYQRLGFRLTGAKAGYYADKATALRYEKRLTRHRGRPPRRMRPSPAAATG